VIIFKGRQPALQANIGLTRGGGKHSSLFCCKVSDDDKSFVRLSSDKNCNSEKKSFEDEDEERHLSEKSSATKFLLASFVKDSHRRRRHDNQHDDTWPNDVQHNNK
jgi:hypothetical protein